MIRDRLDFEQPVKRGRLLRIHLLGPAWIEWDGQPLGIRRRQARALLYRLAAQLRPVAREEICYAFWPDEPDAQGRRYLSHLLSHLRQALPLPELVCCNNELVELDPDRTWSDTWAFRAACATPGTQRIDVLEQAIDLYRGPFLAGFSLPDRPEFELWASEQRTLHERLYLDALATLVTAEANREDYARAIQYARAYLKIDELAEEVHRRLMVLHIMTGNRPAALQQYQDCASILKRELNVVPLPETRAVYQAITQNE